MLHQSKQSSALVKKVAHWKNAHDYRVEYMMSLLTNRLLMKHTIHQVWPKAEVVLYWIEKVVFTVAVDE